MITKRNEDGSWSASCRGALRPIVVEAETRPIALQQCYEAIERQESEEYHFEQSMSHLAEIQPYGVPR
jgi:hypothetical protein